jgi:hypothetical protein
MITNTGTNGPITCTKQLVNSNALLIKIRDSKSLSEDAVSCGKTLIL